MKLQKFIGNRIKEMRNAKNINQEHLAEMLDTTKQTISRYENGERKVNQDILFELSSIFNVSIDDFFPNRDEFDMEIVNSDSYTFFPTAISAGTPLTVDGITDASKISISDEVLGKYANDPSLFFVRANGDSMNNKFDDGSLLAVKPISQNELKNGDIVIFSHDGEYSVKHYYKTSNNIIFKANSTNPEHFDCVFSLNDDVVIHGKVITYIVNV